MVALEWDEQYSVHNEQIDKQHQQLFHIAKQAAILIHKQVDSKEIKAILVQLFDYMKFHFRDEEAYMERIGYPQLLAHREIHRAMIERVTDLIQNIKYDFKQKLAIITRDWLVEHIMREDKKIEQWYEKQQLVQGAGTAGAHLEGLTWHLYRCDCRSSFRVLETVHKKILGGQDYHCKKCNAKIIFLQDTLL